VPLPNLDHKLDFNTAGVSSTAARKIWGKQFLDDSAAGDLTHIDLGNGHMVLARSNVDARELVP
jgi:peptide/nickel transport system ATP-binding protein